MKRQCLQGVADQDRRCLVISLMTRWTTATKVVVIHCRQIIVNERVNVYELDGAGGAFNLLLRPAYGTGGSEEQRGSDALAPTQDGVSHRFMQAGRHNLRARKPGS
jgi:hypothetical protein